MPRLTERAPFAGIESGRPSLEILCHISFIEVSIVAGFTQRDKQ